MPFTEYLDQALMAQVFGGQIWTPPANYYIGLSATEPTQNDGGNLWNITEPSGNAYGRVVEPNTTPNWAVEGSLSVATSTGGWTMGNVNAVTFPMSTGAWLSSEALGWFFFADGAGALSPGSVNVLIFGACNPSETVEGTGTTLSFGAGQLTATNN